MRPPASTSSADIDALARRHPSIRAALAAANAAAMAEGEALSRHQSASVKYRSAHSAAQAAIAHAVELERLHAPKSNPLLGTGLGVLFGLGAVASGAWIVKALLERRSSQRTTGVLGPGTGPTGPAEGPTGPISPGGTPASWLAEVQAVLRPGATLKEGGLMAEAPFALNVFGRAGVEGPTTAQFPYMTQPEAFWIRSKEGAAVPMLYLYTSSDGMVGFRMDLDKMGGKGVAIDESQVIYGDGTYAGTLKQTDNLITNLSEPIAQSAYGIAILRIKQNGDAYDMPSGTRDAYIKQVLTQWVPGFDWSAAPDSLGNKLGEWTSSVAMLWQGVSLVGQIAYQNLSGNSFS